MMNHHLHRELATQFNNRNYEPKANVFNSARLNFKLNFLFINYYCMPADLKVEAIIRTSRNVDSPTEKIKKFCLGPDLAYNNLMWTLKLLGSTK